IRSQRLSYGPASRSESGLRQALTAQFLGRLQKALVGAVRSRPVSLLLRSSHQDCHDDCQPVSTRLTGRAGPSQRPGAEGLLLALLGGLLLRRLLGGLLLSCHVNGSYL